MTATRHLALGIFILVALATLGTYTIFLSGMNLFGTTEVWTVQFPEANGLRAGDPVRVAGMRVGRVLSLAFDPNAPADQRITVELRLDQELELREGYSIQIQETTLLGGRNVNIEPGPYDTAALGPDAVARLTGTVPGNPLEALESVGELFSDNSESLTTIVDDVRAMVGQAREEDLVGRLGSSVDEFGEAGRSVQDLVTDARQGDGLLPALLSDSELRERVTSAVDNVDRATREFGDLGEQLNAGEGELGKLLVGEQGYTDLEATLASIRGLAARLDEEDGALGRMLADEATYAEFQELVASLRKSVDGVVEQDGGLGRLFLGETSYASMRTILDDVEVITSQVRSGEGTVGRLVMRDDLYEALDLALGTLNRALEDYRESAPVSTFTSVFFGAF